MRNLGLQVAYEGQRKLNGKGVYLRFKERIQASFALHQLLQHSIKSERKHVAICNKKLDLARWQALNLVEVPFQYFL